MRAFAVRVAETRDEAAGLAVARAERLEPKIDFFEVIAIGRVSFSADRLLQEPGQPAFQQHLLSIELAELHLRPRASPVKGQDGNLLGHLARQSPQRLCHRGFRGANHDRTPLVSTLTHGLNDR